MMIDKLIKRRIGKNSNRGIYIQDKELRNTNFQVGGNFKYVVDVNNNKIVILPTNEKAKNTVSKRLTKDGLKPIIDIRSKDALNSFQGMDYLQISIFEDSITVEGFVNDKENDINSCNVNKSKCVKDITQLIKVKKKVSTSIPKILLSKAVGSPNEFNYNQVFEQLSLNVDTDNIISLKSAFNNLKIPLSVVSLFSGAGVLDKGFIDNGFDVVFAVDIDEGACQTYKHNIGNHIINEDITKINKKELPKASIVIGGSPCQGFSNGNRRTNYLDNPKNLLVKEFIDTVKANDECKVFVLENVPQLLTTGDGAFIREIENELKDFEISKGVLCSADYGTAQKRHRAIVVGSKLGKIELPKPFVTAYKTVREAFKGLSANIPNQNDYSKPTSLTKERMSHVPPGGNINNIPLHIKPKGGHSCSYKRLEWDKTSITIMNPRKNNITHPSLNRSLSVRECARLFGLSDSFIFKGTLSSMQQQIANAVPYNLSYAIAKSIKKFVMRLNAQVCIQN
jgi:DNA (cytosine-5)-methyltransferase 1